MFVILLPKLSFIFSGIHVLTKNFSSNFLLTKVKALLGLIFSVKNIGLCLARMQGNLTQTVHGGPKLSMHLLILHVPEVRKLQVKLNRVGLRPSNKQALL